MADTDMFRRLILSDGTVLNNCESGYSENNLWCYLYDVSFGEAFLLFSDPVKFNQVRFEYGFDDRYTRITYTGLDDIRSLEKREFTVDVCLTGTNVTVTTERISLDPERGDSNA